MEQQPPDLVLVNGRIWTWPPHGPDASALLVRGGRVAAVGDEAVVSAAAGGARRLDLEGATVLPGFIDAHCHLLSYGESLSRRVDLRGASSLEALQDRLRERIRLRPPVAGEWVLGRSFDQDRLPGARMPTAADLDAVSRELPIVIQRVCGHALIANTRAQALAGVRAPEGFLAEDDMDPVWRAVPPPTTEEKVEAAALACREAASVGYTGVHCILSAPEDLAAFRELARRGPLPVHARLMIGHLELLDPPGAREAVPCRTLKLFADGSLGAHTAAMAAPYTDMPETSGRLLFTDEELSERVGRAHRAGYQLAVHAIGDAAVAQAAAAIAAAQAAHPRPDARHRIEHASVLSPALTDRLALLGTIAVVQPQFVVSDFWTGTRLGEERAAWAYPFRSMQARGVRLAGSTDCPVEALDPFESIARAAGRAARDQRLNVPEAIALFTRGSAFAGFQEHECGALLPGCRADLIVLAEDPRRLRPARIARLRPELTLTAGRAVHTSGRFAV
ncbi:MAG: amidohydrolase [Armatimonadetes bacterium]|nr:amidohydrolase [Armatimonadota bacterium]